ncbi:MAG: single-stranded-DNA-specific exonuclease [Thermomicrobiales bacterium]|jgi:single-stranded-DNA-specific exonuclease|nr:single-stranded-DNA-specific exonuclease [Thermomicrobiales bacterium]
MVYVQTPPPRSRSATRPIWIEPAPLPPNLPALHDDPLIAELLFRREILDPGAAADFLHARPRPAPDPSLLPNMDAAVERILRAVRDRERVAIFGDYDVDGITSTALLTRALRAALGDPDRVIARLPTRREGYGLNPAAIDDFASAGASLLIAVDCASSDDANVGYARARGLDVVVVDHHHMSGPGPDGAIVLSPHLSPGGPYREFAAVGVVYLLVAALAQHGCRIDGTNGDPETSLLDYVALGTIGDVSPLIGANRALVRDGLKQIHKQQRPGLVALIRKAGLDPSALTADRIAFKVTPRLNAAGRMGDPHLALDLLLTDDPLTAAMLADEIERLNTERREVSARIADEAEALILSRPDWRDRRLLIVAGRGWTAGVLGIAANQLVNRFGRPVLVLADDGELSKGSARSVPGFDIVEALGGCGDLLSAWGGHSQAAGLTIRSAQLDALADALDAQLVASGLDLPVPPSIRLDAVLPAERLTVDTAHRIDALQPFGTGNEQPLFLIRDVQVRQYEAIGQDRSHLRLVLSTPRGNVKAIAFGAAPRSRELVLSRTLDLAACLNLDRWNGQTRLDLEVKDFRPAE